MLHKTKGIVINYIAYRETSIIVKIYTEKFGMQTYIENGVRTAKGKNKIALFQPMTLLDLVVYHHHKKDLHRISEIKCTSPLISIPFEVRKSTISMFINEVLNKTLKEQSENETLFFFLYSAILTFDSATENIENFHLIFLAKYSSFLGFAPEGADEIENQFLEFGVNILLDKHTKSMLNSLFEANFNEKIAINKSSRNQLLQILLSFYRLHQEEFGELKSLSVLKEIFSE